MLGLTTFCPLIGAATFDGGGQRVASASYTIDGNIGDIGGAAAAGPAVARHGYIGQLTEVVSITVTALPVSVNEGSTNQLGGAATMDDATVVALTGWDVSWNPSAYPVASIDGSGVATMSTVYSNMSGTFSGEYLGVLGTGSLLVVDSSPDNYGYYADDGLPDSWQVQYFGFDNPDADPTTDVSGTGQNNLFKYVAGLDPTNSASVFVLQIQNVAGQPNQKKLIFNPRYADRTYASEFRTDLLAGNYGTLTSTITSDNGLTRTVTDTNAVETSKFYRIRITYP